MINTIKKRYHIFVLLTIVIIDLFIILGRLNYYNKSLIVGNTILTNAYEKNLVSNGWAKVGRDYYYCKDATIVTDEIIAFEDKLYYLDKQGKLVRNKKIYRINDSYYSIDRDGALTIISN